MLQTKKEFVGLTFFINGVYKNTPELTQEDMKSLGEMGFGKYFEEVAEEKATTKKKSKK